MLNLSSEKFPREGSKTPKYSSQFMDYSRCSKIMLFMFEYIYFFKYSVSLIDIALCFF